MRTLQYRIHNYLINFVPDNDSNSITVEAWEILSGSPKKLKLVKSKKITRAEYEASLKTSHPNTLSNLRG